MTVERDYFRVATNRMTRSDERVLRPDVIVPLGCDMQVIAYAPDLTEALVKLIATDRADLMDRFTMHMPVKKRPTKFGKNLIGEFVSLNPGSAKFTPVNLAKSLYQDWTGSDPEAVDSPFKTKDQYLEGENVIDESRTV